MLLKRPPEFSSCFHGYTRAFYLPMGQSGTRRRDDTMLVGPDFSGMATRVDTHFYDVLGIGLRAQERSA